MGRKLSNVVGLYTDGIHDGYILPAADKYLAEHFIDMSYPAASTRLDFVEAYEPLVHRYRDRYVRPIRGFEDSTLVFLHSYHSFGRGMIKYVCVDVFDTDEDDQVVARWNITVPVVSPTRTGRSQIDGPTTVVDRDRTDDNKKLARTFIADVLVDGHWDNLEHYLDPRRYLEHSPTVSDGVRGVRYYLTHHADAGRAIRYRRLLVLVGAGNFVTTLCTATRGSQPYQVFDIFRCAGGRIVEHWDAAVDIVDPGAATW